MTAPTHKSRPLWELTRGQRLRYSAAVLITSVAALLVFCVPLISRAVIDGVLAPSSAASDEAAGAGTIARWLASFGSTQSALLAATAAAIVLTSVAAGLLYLRGRWMTVASETLIRSLRDRLFAHLGRLPCSFHDGADTGDLVQRCTSDVETVRLFLSTQVLEIGRTLLSILVLAPILCLLDPAMALIAFALMPPIALCSWIFFRRVQSLFLEMDEAEGALTSVLQENLTGIRVVRAFARQEYECAKFAEKNATFRDKNFRLIRMLGVFWSVSDLFCFGQIALILFAGATRVLEHTLTVGTLFVFLSCAWMVIWPVRQLGRVLADSGKALVALRRLDEILGEAEEARTSGADAATGTSVLTPQPRLRGSIELERVSFAYPPRASGASAQRAPRSQAAAGDEPAPVPVLRELSLSIRAGETVALLGPPGAGKSTLAMLLLRLYDYDSGSIRIDGHELRTLEREHVRRSIATVLQEPFLFSRTLAENLRLGQPDASDAAIASVADDADLSANIERFTDGLETPVGERGVTLSGGQRQRMAIARALVEDAPILLLDDALSAVDTRTEGRILDALRRRSSDRTTILIAHRLSSVRHADRIFVLADGAVAQAGSHAELIDQPGAYRRLWKLQNDLEHQLDRDEFASAAHAPTPSGDKL